MFELLLFALAGCALVLVAVYGELKQRQRPSIRLPAVRLPAMAGRSRKFTPPARPQTVSRAQQDQLVRLLRGDRAAARRLVAHVQEKYPEKSERWCWEKAIYDIERDRRRY